MKKAGLFAAGLLFGTAGLKMLGSEVAMKKVYAKAGENSSERASWCCLRT